LEPTPEGRHYSGVGGTGAADPCGAAAGGRPADRPDRRALARPEDHYRPLIARVLEHSEHRVLHRQAVPAGEKLVSLFEPHADIIVNGARDVQYGHKLNLVTGKSGLILDFVIESGNPADAKRFLPMLDRHIASCGTPPRQMAADGSDASHDNLNEAKAGGVRDSPSTKSAVLPSLTSRPALSSRALSRYRLSIRVAAQRHPRSAKPPSVLWGSMETCGSFYT
jgi:hypothetical protein